MYDNLTITRATAADADHIAKLIAGAFAPHLPVCRWLVPTDECTAIHERYFRLHVDHALEHGTVEVIGDGDGVAVWFLHRAVPGMEVPEIADYDQRLKEATGEWVERFAHLECEFDRHHPHDEDHDHLAFLAVTADHQGQGLGSALVRHHHRLLDADRLGAYLEASSPDSARLYQRLGYEYLGEAITLPDGAQLWPMMRHAAPRTER